MKIIITGAAGFIFSNWVKNRLKHHKDDQIRIIDTLSYAGSLDNLLPYKDLKDFDWATNPVKEWYYHQDLMIIAHAESHVDNSIENPGNFIQANIVSTFKYLEAARQAEIPKIIYISTDEVVERRKPVFTVTSFAKKTGYWSFWRPREDCNEFSTSSPYSASKAAGELLVQAYRKTYGMNIDIVRMTNNYGPNQHEEKLIPKVIKKALNGEKIPVYGTGEQFRDWIHVNDTCKAIDLIINQKCKNKTWHIASNKEVQNIELIKLILQLTGKSEDLIEFVEDRPGHDYSYSLGCENLKSLGWTPQIPLDEGLTRLIIEMQSQ